MLVGYNHNFRYKGALFHVQTEDSGMKNPHIVTHLFHGGTILVTQKTSYADIISVDHLEQVVQDLMKDQHQQILRRLKNGEFDERIRALLGGGSAPADAEAGTEASSPPPSPPKAATEAPQPKEANLEDIVLSYFIGDEEKPS